MVLHDSHMDGIASGDLRCGPNESTCALHIEALYRQDFIDNREDRCECRVDGFSTPDGCIAVKDLLKHFSARHKASIGHDGVSEQASRGEFVGVFRTDQIHRDVRIDEDDTLASQRSGVGRVDLVASVASLDLIQHLSDVGNRELMLCSPGDGLELGSRICSLVAADRMPQRLTYPLRGSELTATRDQLDLSQLVFFKKYLQSLTHKKSL